MNKAEPLPDGRELYRIDCKVRTTPNHPMHFSTSAGILTIWVYAHSNDDAGKRIEPLIGALPFLLVDDKARPLKATAPSNEAEEILHDFVQMIGFAAVFTAGGLDTDEKSLSFPGEKSA